MQLGGVGQGGGLDERLAQFRGFHASQRSTAPGAVRGKGRVGVRRIREGVRRRRELCPAPVLRPIRPRYAGVQGVERAEEALLLAGEEGFVLRQFEDRGHEVLLARTLLEPPDQVGDGDVELFRMHHRGVEQQRADVLLDGFGLPLCHAEQHLELDAVAHSALSGQQPGEREVEQVVPGDADPDIRDAVRV